MLGNDSPEGHEGTVMLRRRMLHLCVDIFRAGRVIEEVSGLVDVAFVVGLSLSENISRAMSGRREDVIHSIFGVTMESYKMGSTPHERVSRQSMLLSLSCCRFPDIVLHCKKP